MAYLLIPSRAYGRVQPKTDQLEIDWSNPWAQNLQSAYLPGLSRVDYARPRYESTLVGTTSTSVYRGGGHDAHERVLHCGNAGMMVLPYGTRFNVASGPVTIYFRAYIPSEPTFQIGWWLGTANEAGQNLFHIALGEGAFGAITGEMVSIVKQASGSVVSGTQWNVPSGRGAIVGSGQIHSFLITSTGSAWSLEVDGVPRTLTDSYGNNGLINVSGVTTCCLGGRYISSTPGGYAYGGFSSFMFWSGGRHHVGLGRILHQAPWQMFKKRDVRFYSLPSASTTGKQQPYATPRKSRLMGTGTTGPYARTVAPAIWRAREKRITQPDSPTDINWSHPLLRGCVGVWDARRPRIFGKATWANNTTGISARSSGIARDFGGNTYVSFNHHSTFAITGELTIGVVVNVDTFTNYSQIINKLITGGTSYMPYQLRLGAAITDKRIHLSRAHATAYKSWTSNDIFETGRDYAIMTASSSSMEVEPRFHVNARQITGLTGTGTGTGAAADNGSSPIWIGSRPIDSVTYLDGGIYLIALWNRQLHADEAVEWTHRPWQIFAGHRSRIFLPV